MLSDNREKDLFRWRDRLVADIRLAGRRTETRTMILIRRGASTSFVTCLDQRRFSMRSIRTIFWYIDFIVLSNFLSTSWYSHDDVESDTR